MTLCQRTALKVALHNEVVSAETFSAQAVSAFGSLTIRLWIEISPCKTDTSARDDQSAEIDIRNGVCGVQTKPAPPQDFQI
ncbi:hypothetical protein LTR99_003842 [Exophiala xenobiotica]|nr:hypothetical protein LTR99_003842 [Exophiala xenobiotica]KAK5412778.1 hypothetical protein LTR90_006899 [Exophiala xenobiotica]KAK5435310.1 hypothetical protein LTR34_002813 [Exophiala xenobiotica]KAK5461413.1 hypothetical protein LTR20_006336 [Exophiala xenobiotica]KAK5506804.1 hypothetical protein LTR21_009014 [Exophiala xenobiotica]